MRSTANRKAILKSVESSFEAQFRARYEEQAQKIGRFNLGVFGKTGVGKSTLINAIFGEDVAATGIGEPVTQEEHLYVHRAGFFGLLDTRGLEIGVDTDTIIRELGEYMDRMRKQPIEDQIHVAWYCVRSTDNRFENTEAEFVRRLQALGLPVIVVLTQVPSRDGVHHPDAISLSDHIAGLELPIEGGRPILVMSSADDFTRQEQHGMQDLLDATFRAAPDAVEAALAAAQKIDMDRKWARAQTRIIAAGAASAAVGAIPIPIADAAILVPIQLALMASVSAIYGVKVETAAMAASAATTVAAGAGRMVAVGLIKLIPGPGWIVGGAVSAVTASTFTLAMGYAWAAVCNQLSQGKLKDLNGMLDNEAVVRLFKDEFTKWLNNLRPAKD
jgi:uncharacterized protein (DUF697 family)/GTP-binding protein EngB required for normal cell division